MWEMLGEGKGRAPTEAHEGERHPEWARSQAGSLQGRDFSAESGRMSARWQAEFCMRQGCKPVPYALLLLSPEPGMGH